jgi:hypothetical protein
MLRDWRETGLKYIEEIIEGNNEKGNRERIKENAEEDET